jgi:hypothetical protein
MPAIMRKNDVRREAIMALLSDAEGETKLIEGDEYVDLEHADQGVQLAQAVTRTPPGHALPRSSVADATWAKIVRAVAH